MDFCYVRTLEGTQNPMRTIAFALMQAASRTSPLCFCCEGWELLGAVCALGAPRAPWCHSCVCARTALRCCVLGSSPSFCCSCPWWGSRLGEQGQCTVLPFFSQLLHRTEVRLLEGSSCARVLI